LGIYMAANIALPFRVVLAMLSPTLTMPPLELAELHIATQLVQEFAQLPDLCAP